MKSVWFIWVLLHPSTGTDMAKLPGSFDTNWECALETAEMAERAAAIGDSGPLICIEEKV